jgi:galactose oxidase
MPNLGNAWHIPTDPKPRGRAGMRNPVGDIVPGAAVTIYSGNQYQGGGNPGNQLEVGSAIFFKRAADVPWQTLPLLFDSALDNDKFFRAVIPPATFATLDVVQYYLRIAYSDHDTTFIAQSAGASVTVASEAAAQAAPFTFIVEDSAVRGEWGPLFDLPNVGIHANLLPNGRVLMWGRRDQPTQTLDEHDCTPFVWDPATGGTTFTNQPTRANPNEKVNLFCSGHAFLADGRLLVVGGHWLDEDGINQACLFDFNTNLWTATAPMTLGGAEVRRWYPTARTLPDGTVLVFSGSYLDPMAPVGQRTVIVDLLQVWDNGTWRTVPQADNSPLDYDNPPLYPRLHGASDGRLLMSGPNDRALLLKATKPGAWTDPTFRTLGERQYAPAVQYDKDKVIYIGGGNAANTFVPTAGAEVIDLAATAPQWTRTNDMNFPRRQHNATVLPDGTVLVVGGTRGGGGPNKGFNDLGPGMPVPFAEVWDPSNGRWTVLAAEDMPRCYHSTAVLLPDGRVLSAGGGEYKPDNMNPNAPEDSYRNAQIFSPPYLFKGPRPSLTAPKAVDYGATFAVTTDQAAAIQKVTLIRLASVTHSFDANQHVVFLAFAPTATTLNVTAPTSANECPPGHYMLFVVNAQGVPSVASIVKVGSVAAAPLNAVLASALVAAEPASRPPSARPKVYLSAYAPRGQTQQPANGTRVLVGLTGTCPYGIGACWGGAYEALGRLESVAMVGPIPNTADSTADVFLHNASLPPLDLWQQQFRSIVNGSYILRGVELTLRGSIEMRQTQLLLQCASPKASLRLAALTPGQRMQWDHVAQARKAPLSGELEAYARLFGEFRQRSGGSETLTVTGPLVEIDGGYRLYVRQFSWAG